MSRLRPFRARVGVAGAASLAALSLLVTSLTPLATRANAADESTRETDVASSQDAATASSDNEVTDVASSHDAVTASSDNEVTDEAVAAEGVTAPAAARDESATLAMTGQRVQVDSSGRVVRGGNGLPVIVDSDELLAQGDHILYTISVRNDGTVDAQGLTLVDRLPEGLEYVSSETRLCQQAQAVPCTEGASYEGPSVARWLGEWAVLPSGAPEPVLKPGAAATTYVVAKVSSAAQGRAIKNTATLGQRDQADANVDNNSVSVTHQVGAVLSGLVFNDRNASWGWAWASFYAGVSVRLLDENGVAIKDGSGVDRVARTGEYEQSAVDSDMRGRIRDFGRFAFTRLPLGNYKVEVVPGPARVTGGMGPEFDVDLTDYKLTYAYGSSIDRSQAGQGKLLTPNPIELSDNTPVIKDVDFGFHHPVRLGDYVWNDANQNGLQDDGESGVSNVTVMLADEQGASVVDADGQPVEPVKTDANGNYLFANLLAGRYRVTFDVPTGYAPTISEVGEDAWLDSDGVIAEIFASYDPDFSIDLGLIGQGGIGGTLVWDVNRSGGGVPDEGDKLLPGVAVTLSYTTAGGVEKTQTAVTDDNGKYSFSGLAPGNYLVTVDEVSLAAACSECNGQTYSPEGVLPAGDGQALALSAKVTLTSAAMLRSDQDWAFAVVPDEVVPDEPGTDEPVAPADPVPADPEAPAVDGGGSTAQPSASGNQTHVPSVNSGPSLARTGSDASVLGGMAAMAAIAGFAALAGKCRRDREDA